MPRSAAGDRSVTSSPSSALAILNLLARRRAARGAKGLMTTSSFPLEIMRAITVGALGGLVFEDNAAAPIAVRVLLWFVNAAAAGTVDCGCV